MTTKRSRRANLPNATVAMRQGDILLLSIDHPAAGPIGEVEPAPVDARGVVLAEGEHSGHHHEVIPRSGGAAHLFRFRDARADRLLEVGTGGADVRVIGGGSMSFNQAIDRHHAIALDAGRYIVRVQKSYTAGYVRQVAD